MAGIFSFKKRVQFIVGDQVMYVTRKVNDDFLNHLKNVPTVVERVIPDRSYRSGIAIKIPLHHDPIDSYYFDKLKGDG